MSDIKLPPVNWLGEGQPVPSVAEMRNHLQNFAGEVLALNTLRHTEAEVQEISGNRPSGNMERTVRRILGVPAP